MWHVRLDIRQKRSSICILNERSERVRAQTVGGPWAKLFEALRAIEQPFAACYEASLGYGYLYQQIGAIARSVWVGHITHEGPSMVRHLITEAAWHGTRLSPTIRAYFERIVQGNEERRKTALVATGHYLLRVMHAMLRDGTPWLESVPAASTTAPVRAAA